MNIAGLVAKVGPHLVKWGPIALGALTGGVSALGDQRRAAELADMKNRIADLEKLVKKD